MKTVFYANIDGFDIVLGIGDPTLDIMGTSKIIDEPFQASDEVKALRELNFQLDAEFKAMQSANGQAQFDEHMQNAETLKTKFPQIAAAIDIKRSALMAEFAQWCQPGSGENLIEEIDAEKLLAVAKPGFKVKLDGTQIVDNRGTIFWTFTNGNWTSGTITSLGEIIPKGSINQNDLTDTQRAQINAQMDSQRIAGLTDAQKLAEAISVHQAAKVTVSSVQSEVAAGINTQDALTSAVAAYKAALAAINAKYGTNLT